MTGFDIVLYNRRAGDGAVIYWAAIGTPFSSESDVWTVVLHELGHALGLDHSNSPSVVMGTTCGNGCSRRVLYSDDKDGIQALYGLYTNEGFWSDVTTATPGQAFLLHLDYPRAAGRNFGLSFNSDISGSTPMPPPDSRILPLASPYENARNYGAIFLNPTCLQGGQCQNMFGTLDANGQATVAVQLPSDALTSLGPNLYLAAVTRNTSMPSDYEDISVGVHVRIGSPDPGDLDNNGHVDLDDFAMMFGCLGGPKVTVPPQTCPSALFVDSDINADGVVDLEDVALLQASFTGP